MTFRFWGTNGRAAAVLYGWGVVMLLSFGIGYAWWRQRLQRFVTEHTEFGGVRGEFSATGGAYLYEYFHAVLRGMAYVLPGAVLLILILPLSLDASGVAMVSYYLSLAAVYLGYIAGFGVLQAKLHNLVWNSTRLGPISFEARFNSVEMAWLYMSNTVAVVASLGLLIPWAAVRMTRYKVACIAVYHRDTLCAFKGDEKTTVSAYGAEVGDFFDLEFSL
jgi:uncharacterized membrane protein YjgN (DUF898 family)